jgi:hypothetical protein
MISRRAVLGGGVFGAASMEGGAAAEQSVPADPRQVRELIGEVREISETLRLANTASFTGTSVVAERIRDQMVVFLRANNKYPDYLDVGIQVFHAMYDWHIHNRLPLVVGRSADGRYGLGFMFTRLILRPDAVPDFIGIAYDQRG